MFDLVFKASYLSCNFPVRRYVRYARYVIVLLLFRRSARLVSLGMRREGLGRLRRNGTLELGKIGKLPHSKIETLKESYIEKLGHGNIGKLR